MKFGRNGHTGKMTIWHHIFYCATTDPLQRRHGQLLAGILLGYLVLIVFTLIRGVLEPTRPFVIQALLGAAFGSISGLYWLNRRGAVTAASAGMILMSIVALTGFSITPARDSTQILPPIIDMLGLIVPVGLAGVFLPTRIVPALVILVSLDTVWLAMAGAPTLVALRAEHPDQVSFLIVNAIILYLLTGFFTGAGSYLVNQALRDAQRANQSLREAQARERRRIIRELHDGPLQEIVGIMRLAEQCDILLAEGNTARAQALLALCAARGELVVAQIRALVRDLRPQELENTTLTAALHQLVARMQEAGISVTIHYTLTNSPPLALETALFRMVQEGLTNIRKHARAQHAWVSLKETPHTIQLEIRDDGQGFEPAQVARQQQTDHMGLENMVDRTADLGGQLTIRSAPGHGTTLQVILPLSERIASEPTNTNKRFKPSL